MFVALLWTPLNRSMYFLCWGLQSCTLQSQSSVEGENYLPQLAGHVSSDGTQDMFGFMGSEHKLSAHTQFFIHQLPQVLLTESQNILS